MSDDESYASDEEVDEVDEVTDLSNRYVVLCCCPTVANTSAYQLISMEWLVVSGRKCNYL